MKKTRVLVLNQPDTLNNVTYWRLYRPFSLLQREYGNLLEIHYNRGQLLPTDLLNYDVYFAIRPSLPEHLHAIAAIRDNDQVAGYTRPIVIDIDDDNTTVPAFHTNWKDEGANIEITRKCVELATEIWCSTAQIAQNYAPEKSRVIPNAVLPEDVADAPTSNLRRTIFAGTQGHAHDIVHEANTWGQVRRFGNVQWAHEVAARADVMEWIGYMPPINPRDNWKFTPHMPINQFFRHIRGASVWWKPLADIPFNHAKSNIALLRATCAGMVCVTNAANWPGWGGAMSYVPTTAADHADHWHAAREIVLQHYNLHDVNYIRASRLCELAGEDSEMLKV